MKLHLHTVSRDKNLYYADAVYSDGIITVLANSKININQGENFKNAGRFSELLCDRTLIDENGILKKDICFQSLSTAATFVTGRIANGMIVWKTDDNRYVRYSLNATTE